MERLTLCLLRLQRPSWNPRTSADEGNVALLRQLDGVPDPLWHNTKSPLVPVADAHIPSIWRQ